MGALSRICSSVDIFSIPSDASRLQWVRMVMRGLMRSTPYDVNWLESEEMMHHVGERCAPAKFRIDPRGTRWDSCRTQICSENVARVLNHHNVESLMMERKSLT
jgi:hypothetical protein